MWTPLNDSLCELGESPFWHPGERSLYWVDIPGKALCRTRGEIARATVERWSMPSEPGCIAPARSGGLVIALRDGIHRARAWGGALVRLAGVDYDVATMRFNDGKCDPLGRFWASTLNERKDAPNAALYCLHARAGRAPMLQRMANEATTGNGLAFDARAGCVYWSDTAAHRVRAWAWASEPNTLSDERTFVQFAPKPAGSQAGEAPGYAGRPDGATLDAEGHYWAAMFEGGQLLRFTPAGVEAGALATPARCPTMPCFGGDDLRTLFVTTARRGRPAVEIAEHPDSGRVFWTRVPVPGLPVDFFDD